MQQDIKDFMYAQRFYAEKWLTLSENESKHRGKIYNILKLYSFFNNMLKLVNKNCSYFYLKDIKKKKLTYWQLTNRHLSHVWIVCVINFLVNYWILKNYSECIILVLIFSSTILSNSLITNICLISIFYM